jgi:monoamine oxidase
VTDVLVIGAGIAGLAAARELMRRGIDVDVLEARERIGGRIHTVHDVCGMPVEAGAEFIHGVHAATWPDVARAGLTTRPCPNTTDSMFDLGYGARWLPLVLAHPAVWPTFTILRRIARAGPTDLSAREFVERAGYRGRARTLAAMVLTAHLPGSLDEIGVVGLVEDGVLKLERGRNLRIAEGYGRLAEGIATGVPVEHGFIVESVEWGAGRVRVRATDRREREARAAICTLPVGVLQSGAVRFSPDLPERKLAALGSMVMGPVSKIVLVFEERFWPRRLATLACGVGPVTLYWPVFYGVPPSAGDSAEPPAVLTAYATGPRAAALGRMSDDEAVATVLDHLGRLFPRAAPRLTSHRRIDWAADQFSRGGYTFLRPGGTGARARLAAADTGALFWAGDASATRGIAATVEGAFTSGLRAAGEAASFLSGGRGARYFTS